MLREEWWEQDNPNPSVDRLFPSSPCTHVPTPCLVCYRELYLSSASLIQRRDPQRSIRDKLLVIIYSSHCDIYPVDNFEYKPHNPNTLFLVDNLLTLLEAEKCTPRKGVKGGRQLTLKSPDRRSKYCQTDPFSTLKQCGRLFWEKYHFRQSRVGMGNHLALPVPLIVMGLRSIFELLISLTMPKFPTEPE